MNTAKNDQKSWLVRKPSHAIFTIFGLKGPALTRRLSKIGFTPVIEADSV